MMGFYGCSNAETPPRLLSYEIDRIEDGVKITLHMEGDADGLTEFKLGEPWADETTPQARFKNIHTGNLNHSRDDNLITVEHNEQQDITISWELQAQDGRGASRDPTYFFAPVIRPDYIHLIGYSALITPVTEDDVKVRLSGRAFENMQSVTSKLWMPDTARPANMIPAGFLILGDIDTAVSDKIDLSVGVAPNMKIKASTLIDEIEPILESLSNIWGGDLLPYHVTLQPIDPSIGSVLAGTAFPGGFAAALSPDTKPSQIGGFLTHEAAHEWIPTRLGRIEFEGDDREPESYWITEGFTEFLSRQAQLKSNMIDEKDYITLVNKDLVDLYMSPAKTYTNQQIGELFWTNREVERLPYLRGFLLAVKWDSEIKMASENQMGLIDALKSIEADNKSSLDGITLTSDLIIKKVKAFGALDPQLDFTQFISAGNSFLPPDDMLGPSFSLMMEDLHPYDVGFDVTASLSSGIIEGVQTGSNAYEAGLRNGMTFIKKISGGQGNTKKDLVLRIESNGTKRKIKYRPITREALKVPQFEAKF